MVTDPRARLDIAPMSLVQIIAVALTFLLSALDGYDVLSMSFAAPAILKAWGIGKAALGLALSAGLVGMAVGSLLLAPLADIIGRKTMILVSLAVMATGMLASALAPSLPVLALWRVWTGIGIGACVAVINPVSAEFANVRRRPLTVSIMSTGYPVGGVAGGLVASWLLRTHGWPAVFLAGFVASAAMIPLVAVLMPESLAFLLGQRNDRSLARVNAVLARCRQPAIDQLPDVTKAGRRGYAIVFGREQVAATVWITSIFLLLMMAIYFVLSWLPQMVADAGYPPSAASLVSALMSTVGVVGGILLGWLAQRLPLRWLSGGAMGGLGLAIIVLGFAPPVLGLLAASGALCGFFIFSTSSGAYATLATVFPDTARASGTGFVLGVGRISSAIGPLTAGALFAGGFGRSGVSSVFGGIALLGASILMFGWTRFRHR